MKRLALYLISVVTVAMGLVSCKGDGKSLITPASSGRPYEILVVADDNCWKAPDSALYHVLDSDVPGLPQSERSFRISRVPHAYYDRSMRLFRNIILTDINPELYTQTKFKYARDVYSSPQMILIIQSPSQREVADYVSKNGNVIVDFFTRAEMNREIKELKQKHNRVISAKAGSMFDCDVWMPLELESYKEGKDFLWASSNLNDLNFVMYSYPFRDNDTFTKAYFIHKRDSVMKINLPGAREGMYMETDSMMTDVRPITVQGEYALEVRGLWRVKGDFMGGPFVSHARVDQKNHRVVVAEIFVYSPDKLKRNLVRQMEASLYTLRLPEKESLQGQPAKEQSAKTEK